MENEFMNQNAPIPVRAVDFVMYTARDMESLRRWYGELFGLAPGGEWHRSWSEFATEPVTLCLNSPGSEDKDARHWGRNGAIALAVGDILSAERECRKRKVTVVIPPVESSVCWMMLLADPEGNHILLHQRKNGTAG
jgi:predicted enzyme related to lactoylglutathione lyase